MSNALRRIKVTVDSFTDGHAQRIADSIGVRGGKLAVIEGDATWSALRAAHRVLGHYGHVSNDARAEAYATCVAYWNERFSTLPCHYCAVAGYEINRDNVCLMCEGTGIHPDGDDPHDDGEEWNGKDCGVCGGVS
jgi:hypothetical protein